MSTVLHRTLATATAMVGVAVLSATTYAGSGVSPANATTKSTNKTTTKAAAKVPGEDWIRILPVGPKEAVVIDYAGIRKITGTTFDPKDRKSFAIIRFITGGGYFTETWATRGSKEPNGFNVATVDYEVTNRFMKRSDGAEVTIGVGIDTQVMASTLPTMGFTKTPGSPFDRYRTSDEAPTPFSNVYNVGLDAKRRVAVVGAVAPTSSAFDVATGKSKATQALTNDRDVAQFLRYAGGSHIMFFFEPPLASEPSPGFPKSVIFGITTTFDANARGHQQAILVYRSAADAKTAQAALLQAITAETQTQSILSRSTPTVSDRTLVVDSPASPEPALSASIFVRGEPFPPLGK